MHVTVTGYRRFRFTGNDGKEISGRTVYYGYEQDDVKGLVCEKVFLSDEKFKSVSFDVGDTLNFEYNRYGKIHAVTKD